jgi:C4-dicarboxylate-specific signal transduction histidine kinase
MDDEGQKARQLLEEVEVLRRRVSSLEAANASQEEMDRELRTVSRELTERVKELNCLYEISKLRDCVGSSLDDVLQGIVDLIPAAWQFPDVTCARLRLEGREFRTKRFAETAWRVATDVAVNGIPAGVLEVYYMAARPAADDGPFLLEEHKLLEAVAGRVRIILERERAEQLAREREQQLIQLDKMAALGTMVSGVAHEINNPNNFIMLNAPVLWDAYRDIVPVLEAYYREHGDFMMGGLQYAEMRENVPVLFDGILEGSKRIQNIVSGLKDFARMDTSDLGQSVDLNAAVRSAATLLTNHIRKSTKRFEVRYAADLPAVKGNRQRLEQVVVNLIQNACESLPDSGKGVFVTTRSAPESKCVVLEVRDEGVGIPLSRLPHITEPFHTTKRHAGGVGLGLSVTTGIVKDHGGTLEFASEPGRGTTATVTLPASGEPGSAPEPGR